MMESSSGWRAGRRIWLVFGFLFATNWASTPGEAQELPPDIQADRLLVQAERHVGNGDFAAAMAALDNILGLQAEHDLELPSDFFFRRAHVAMEGGLFDQARASALRYLEATGREGEDYAAALEVLDEAERRLPEDAFRDCAVCPLMVEVPAGSFLMGAPVDEEIGNYAEGPQHRVTIASPFAVGVYEVTFTEWEACVRGGGCEEVRDEGWGRGARPVINVGFNDVQGFVRWLSRETGQPYRLLSEAEWEYVARAGTESARHWGQSADAQCRYANGFDQDLARTEEGREMIRSREELIEKYPSAPDLVSLVPASCSDGYGPTTAPAGSFEPNGFGLFDVLGNVSEWTEDCWHDGYVGAPSDGSPWIAEDCRERVVHGGGWLTDREDMYSARRWIGFHSPDDPGYNNRYYNKGFRVARSLQ